MLWVEWDPISRYETACQVLTFIRLALLDINYLENIVLQTSFIRYDTVTCLRPHVFYKPGCINGRAVPQGSYSLQLTFLFPIIPTASEYLCYWFIIHLC